MSMVENLPWSTFHGRLSTIMRHRRLTLVLAGGVVLGPIAVPRGQQADLQRPTTDASGRWVFGAKNAQTTPNLSGRWVLNVSRSTLPTFKNGPDDGSMHVSGCCLPKSLVELIDHREPSITIDADGLDIDETGKTHEVHLRETRTTDNADNVNTAAGGKDLHSRSHWEGDSLVTEHSVGISEVRTLAPDGRSQTVALYTGRRSAPPTMIYLMERAADPPPAPRGPEPELRNASTHPMQYYLSLPDGWTPAKRWPVVVAFDGSGKDWLDLAHTFVDARKKLPFILVVPLILTNGGGDLRTHPHYHYSPAVWDAVDTNGKCAFDLEGVAAVLSDVEQTAAAEPRAFVTGFSAAALTTRRSRRRRHASLCPSLGSGDRAILAVRSLKSSSTWPRNWPSAMATRTSRIDTCPASTIRTPRLC